MKKNYILIDYENVPVKSLALLTGDNFQVKVFLGPKNTKLATEFVLAIKALGDRADFIVLEAGGHNALDFHITYYLGQLIAADPGGFYHIISKDTGFDGLIKHVHKSGVQIKRSVSIEAMPCFANLQPDPAETLESKLSVVNTAAVKAAVPSKPASKKKADELVELVAANFMKRKTGMPRSEKTLRSTIRMLCGIQYSEKELDAVYHRLIKKKIVLMENGKLSYPFLLLP